MNELHIFRGGKVVSSNGQKISFGKGRIKQIADTYNRLRKTNAHEAPIVKGHPTDNAPAFGWIDRLVARGLDLFAIPKQVDPDFANDVSMGKHKKISIALYQPLSNHNPAPGEFVLQHVGFVPVPAIKGLRDPTFSGISDSLILNFSENPMDSLQNFKDALGAFLLSLGTADMPVDEGLLSAVMETLTALIEPMIKEEEADAVDESTKTNPAFSALTTANETIELLKTRIDKTIDVAVLSFCEEMMSSGRLLPAQKDEAVELLKATAGIVEFSGAKSPLELAMDSYRNRSPVIEFGELSKPGNVEFSGILSAVKTAGGDIDTRKLAIEAQKLVDKNPDLTLDQALAAICG